MTRRAAFGIQVWSLNQARKKIGGKGTISGKWHPQPALLPTKWVIRANRHEGDIPSYTEGTSVSVSSENDINDCTVQ